MNGADLLDCASDLLKRKTDDITNELIDALEALAEVFERWPLAGQKFWSPVCQECGGSLCMESLFIYYCSNKSCRKHLKRELRTSQSEVASNLVNAYYNAIFGGNRSGKTRLAGTISSAASYGREHPATKFFCRINGIDIDYFPPSHGSVIVVGSLDYNDALEIQRPLLDTLSPKGSKRRDWHAKQQGWLYLPEDFYGDAVMPKDGNTIYNGNTIISKTTHKGPDYWQGTQWDFIWFDEEFSDRRIYQEARLRLVDRGGKILFSMTPKKGRTWVYYKFVKNPGSRTKAYNLDMEDNPHLSKEEVKHALADCDNDAEYQSVKSGKFVNVSGSIWRNFNRAIHTIRPFEIPDEWPKLRGVDFGFTNPFVCLWFAVEPATDKLYLYREYRKRYEVTDYHAREILRYEHCLSCGNGDIGDSEATWQGSGEIPGIGKCPTCGGSGKREAGIGFTIADPEDAGGRATLNKYGLNAVDGVKKNVKDSIKAVSKRLKFSDDGPHFFVFDNCEEAIAEIEGYQYAKSSDDGNEDEAKPLKKDDHACDIVRYVCYFLEENKASTGDSGVTGPTSFHDE